MDRTEETVVRELAYDLFKKYCSLISRPDSYHRMITSTTLGNHVVAVLGINMLK